MKKLMKAVILVLSAVIIYSALPLIPYLFMSPASSNVNNQTNIEKLKDNKGAYFSFLVFGDNHSGLILNDAATLKEIWHMNREDRFRKAPIDFVLNVGDVSLNGKRSHFEAYKKMQALIKYPVIAAIGSLFFQTETLIL